MKSTPLFERACDVNDVEWNLQAVGLARVIHRCKRTAPVDGLR
jgi:hypothetical protein